MVFMKDLLIRINKRMAQVVNQYNASLYKGIYLWENGTAYFGEWKNDQVDG